MPYILPHFAFSDFYGAAAFQEIPNNTKERL